MIAAADKEIESLRCQVESVTFQSEETGYAVLKCLAAEYKDYITVTGYLPFIEPGSEYRFTGEWVKHPKYGRQLTITSFEEILPASAAGIEAYLNSSDIRYIGPVYARKIVAAFGEETFHILDYEPKRLMEIYGIGKVRMEKIKKSWDEKHGVRNLILFFVEHKIKTTYVMRIYRKYGEKSVEKLQKNPYILADEIWGIGFKTADEIAMKLGCDRNSYARLRSGILYTLRLLGQSGHCYEEWQKLADKANELLQVDRNLVSDAIAGMTFDMSASVEEREINGKEEALVYLPNIWDAENGTAVLLQKLDSFPCSLPDDFDFSQLRSGDIEYDPVQLDAIRAALGSKVFVLTGGPGTGKTTTTQGIIKMLVSKNIQFLLAAPTGRAAKRLGETTGFDAVTIHRLLEYSPEEGNFQRNEENPLEGKVLIVDECSMIDVQLMYSLLQAVPYNMTVILIGDVDQLPSVGEGNVLRDIIDCGMFPVVRLTKIFRQAQSSRIIMNAHRINQGKMPDLSNGKDSDFFFIRSCSPEDAAEKVLELARKRLPSHYGISPTSIQVLSPMKKGDAGTISLNIKMQEMINPGSEGLKKGDYVFRLHDKVMQITNNYDKGVFNGDIGEVIELSVEMRYLKVMFDTGVVEYDIHELDELILAYATTIHKSQGSEYPYTIMVLLSSHNIMLQRNLLYTGITRAKKLMVLVGDENAIQRAVQNVSVDKRNTQLASRIRECILKNPVQDSEPHRIQQSHY